MVCNDELAMRFCWPSQALILKLTQPVVLCTDYLSERLSVPRAVLVLLGNLMDPRIVVI